MSLGTSLFIAALPKSLSSFTYQVCRQALNLRDPSWTSDGEILNPERCVFSREPEETGWPKYVPPESSPELFGQLTEFLGQIVSPDGYIYKDVIQPFVVAQWLTGAPLRILKLTRNLTDVVYAMRDWNWVYPQTACDRPEWAADRQAAIIIGLHRAQRTLAQVPGESIDYDDLIIDERLLWQRLSRLYPSRELSPLQYIDDEFRRRRDRRLARRLQDDYRRLQEQVEHLTAIDTR